MPSRAPLVLFGLSAVCFGGMAFATKLATAELSGAEVALLRFALMLAPFLVMPRLVRRAATWERLDLLVYRGLFGGLAVLLYFLAIEHVPVGLAALLNYCSPVFSALFAASFLDERLTRQRLVPLAAALVGVVLVVRSHAGPGELLRWGWWEAAGLASAVLSGAAVTAIRAARRTESSWAVYGSFTLFGLLATAPFGLWQWRPPTPREWLLVALVGALSIAAQLLMTYAYRWVDNLRAGVFAPLGVVVAMALGVVFLGERLTPLGVVGSALAIGGVVATLLPAPGGETAPATPES